MSTILLHRSQNQLNFESNFLLFHFREKPDFKNAITFRVIEIHEKEKPITGKSAVFRAIQLENVKISPRDVFSQATTHIFPLSFVYLNVLYIIQLKDVVVGHCVHSIFDQTGTFNSYIRIFVRLLLKINKYGVGIIL